jgi:hypothetical protein
MSNYPPADGIPSDMQMLLRLIDSKFETHGAKLDGLQNTLIAFTDRFSRYDQKFDDHEMRLQQAEGILKAREVMLIEYQDVKGDVAKLRTWMTEEEAKGENMTLWTKVLWAIGGPAITAVVGWLIVSYVHSH